MMILRLLKYTLATGFGVGYSPFIPGTVGSLAALVIYIALPFNHTTWLLISIIIFFIGTWTSGDIEKDKGKDPGIVIIDEFVGQWIALLFLPRIFWIFLIGFMVFRILDIIKPFPAAKFEKIKGGFGIMLDDVVAGIYTNLILQLLLLINYTYIKS